MAARFEIELREIDIFVTVVNAGGMTAAARQLHMTQSAVSQAVHQLEKKLGVVLLDRSLRPLATTQPGLCLYERSVDLLEQVSCAVHCVRESACSCAAELTIFMINSIASTLGPAVLRNIGDVATRWTIREGVGDNIETDLLAREIDIAIVAGNLAGVDGLERHPLLCEPFLFVLPPNLNVEDMSVQDLARQMPLIRYSHRSADGRRIEHYLQQQRIAIPRRMQFDSAATAIAAVSAGLGWTFATPLYLVQSPIDVKMIRIRPVPGAGFERQLTLIARHSELGSIPERLAAEFIDAYRRKVAPVASGVAPWLINQIQYGDLSVSRTLMAG